VCVFARRYGLCRLAKRFRCPVVENVVAVKKTGIVYMLEVVYALVEAGILPKHRIAVSCYVLCCVLKI